MLEYATPRAGDISVVGEAPVETFAGPVAEHHDGFQMYRSDLCRWNAVEMGPKRDLIGDLADAVRAEEMIFGVSSHRARLGQSSASITSG